MPGGPDGGLRGQPTTDTRTRMHIPKHAAHMNTDPLTRITPDAITDANYSCTRTHTRTHAHAYTHARNSTNSSSRAA